MTYQATAHDVHKRMNKVNIVTTCRLNVRPICVSVPKAYFLWCIETKQRMGHTRALMFVRARKQKEKRKRETRQRERKIYR